MKPTPAALALIVGRVKSAAETKLAGGPPTKADQGDVADPSERGGASVKEDPDAAPGKQGLPANMKNTEGGVPADDQTLQPSTTGKNVPSTQSQNQKDEAATSPTDDLGKIAARVARVNALAAGLTPQEPAKAAAAPTTTPATPAAPAAVAPPAPTTGNKSASTPENGEFGTETLAKLGSLLIASEGGAEIAAALFEKEAGEKEASDMIRLAVAEQAGVAKLAAQADNNLLVGYLEHEKRAALAAAHQDELLKEAAALYEQATPEERAFIEKMAGYAAWAEANITDPLLKLAFESGMADASQDLEAMDAGEEVPTGEEPVGPEQILHLVQAAVENGDLDPATAEALMAQLVGSEGGVPAEEGMAAMDEEMKAASALF